jgi:hypothetical protein
LYVQNAEPAGENFTAAQIVFGQDNASVRPGRRIHLPIRTTIFGRSAAIAMMGVQTFVARLTEKFNPAAFAIRTNIGS